jgi:glycosyltransferase involved in cell wall biosynthesis
MCTYNGERYLRGQLESIAAQTTMPTELVACDDASTDATLSILEAFSRDAPFRVRVTANKANIGAIKNFEQAITQCDGELIALSDQDDVWLPDKLKRLSEAISGTPASAFAFCDAILINENSRPIGGRSLLARRFALASIRRAFAADRALDLLIKRDFIYGTTLMFRADLRRLVLPISETWSHDTWIVNVLTLLGFHGIPVLEPLVQYRQHGGQHSGGMGAPRVVEYAERIRAYEQLYAHLIVIADRDGVRCVPGGRHLIEEKLSYLGALSEMGRESKARRATTALREVLSGRWWRFTPRTFR